MANSNFVVHNGLTVGPLTIDAATGSITTPGDVSITGNLGVSQISKNDSSVTINDTGTGSTVVIKIDGTTEHTVDSNGVNLASGDYYSINGSNVLSATTLGSGVTASSLTSVGTLTGLTTSGTIIASTVQAGTIGNTGAILTGTLSTAAQTNITSVGTLTSLAVGGSQTVGGNLTVSGNLNVTGNVTTFSSNDLVVNDSIIYIADGNSGDVLDIGLVGHFINPGYQHTGFVRDASDGVWKLFANVVAEPGTTVDFSAATYSTLQTGHHVPGANVSYNLGSTTAWWNTVYGKATQAQYADLAENYQADSNYPYGTVVMFGGAKEVTLADADTTRVAGVISQNPAHLMNGGLSGANVVPLALQGRVPCNVIGPVRKGDMMVSAGFGYAKASSDPKVGQVIGKALSDFDGAKGQIEVVVGRV